MPAGMQRYADWVNSLNTGADIDRELLVESPLVHPAATMRVEAVRAIGGYRSGPFPEDYDLWLRLRRAGWRLARVPEVLVHMSDHNGRLTRTTQGTRGAPFRISSNVGWLLAPRRRPRLWRYGVPDAAVGHGSAG